MNISEFAGKIQSGVAGRIKNGSCVSLQQVRKNNGVIMQGLLITKEGQNVAPTIYLDAFWEMYQSGTALSEIVTEIVRIYENSVPGKQVDMEFFREFDKVKDRIAFKLINAGKNKDLLEQIPYVPFLDLAICFYYAYSSKELGSGAILIHNNHMEMWRTDTAGLMKLALANTERLFGMEVKSMEELLGELAGAPDGDMDFLKDFPMRVLSNRRRIYGAACMLYPGLLERIAGEWNASLYILPSSVHEVILLPEKGGEDCAELGEMVREVNASQVELEGVLSDHVYYFDKDKKQIFINF